MSNNAALKKPVHYTKEFKSLIDGMTERKRQHFLFHMLENAHSLIFRFGTHDTARRHRNTIRL